MPAVAATAETAAVRNGAFIAPKPADPGPARPIPLTQPAVPAPPPVREAAAKPKGRVPSLIERVTGVGRARSTPPDPPKQPIPPSLNPAQPRLASLDPADRPAAKEEDLLDIPAFLRRQAN